MEDKNMETIINDKTLKQFESYSEFSKAQAVYRAFKMKQNDAEEAVKGSEALLKNQKKLILISHIKTIAHAFLFGTLTAIGIFALKDGEVARGVASLAVGALQTACMYFTTKEANDRTKKLRDYEILHDKVIDKLDESDENLTMAKNKLIICANVAGVPITEEGLEWAEEQ